MKSDPNAAPAQPPVEPKCTLLAMCVECGEGTELPLPIDGRALGFFLAQRGWFISVMSPPGQGAEAPMVLGPLCTACAQKVYPPEVYAAAEQRRQQLLQAAAQAAQAAQGAR
jgi:hypothetical protein